MGTVTGRVSATHQRLVRRAEELAAFHARHGRLPCVHSTDPDELGLAMFLEATVRDRHRNGTLCPGITSLLAGIPGALDSGTGGTPAAPVPSPARPGLRADAFERWLTRAEIYVERNGYRPTFDDDNNLYQWLNRVRRKLTAGQIPEPAASRVRRVLDFPDIRTHRNRQAHGVPSPGEGSPRFLTGF